MLMADITVPTATKVKLVQIKYPVSNSCLLSAVLLNEVDDQATEIQNDSFVIIF